MTPGLAMELFFEPTEYARRLRAVRAVMAERQLDALICTTPENVFYLTGYQTFAYSTYQALVVPLDGEPFLILRYLESMLADRYAIVRDVVRWEDTEDPVAVTLAALQERGLASGRVGYEERTSLQPVAIWRRLHAGLPAMVDGSGCVERPRAAKSTPELAYMRDAARMTDLGMAAAIAETRPGASENDLAAAAFDAMTRAGSEWMAKDPIVTSGDRSGIPHTTYMRRTLGEGEAVLLEFSAVRHRYFAPLMRSGWLGQLDPRMADWPRICLEAMHAGMEECRPGRTAASVDAACRSIMERYQLWPNYRKRAGYSVGIGFPSWIEGAISSLRADDETVLEAGMCFHIPVALRIYGEATIGISETVIVTATGGEALHQAPREFFVR